jgi:hypothetical protein
MKFKVMFSAWEAQVLSWNSAEIRVVVPNAKIPKGKSSLNVKVFIISPSGECVSNKYDFTVLKTNVFK